MITYSPKTDKDGKFLGMILDDGGAWIPLSSFDAIRDRETSRIRKELELEIGCLSLAGLVSDKLLTKLLAAFDRVIPK